MPTYMLTEVLKFSNFHQILIRSNRLLVGFVSISCGNLQFAMGKLVKQLLNRQWTDLLRYIRRIQTCIIHQLQFWL